MENKSHAMAAGIFVLVVAALLAGLAVWLTRDNREYQLYEMSTKDGVSGLQPQATVRYKGVPVGKVTSIRLDPDPMRNQAVVRLRFDKDLHLSDDSIASVRTSGLIGDKFISISRGGSEHMLAPGDTITETESAVDLGSLISKYAFGGVK